MPRFALMLLAASTLTACAGYCPTDHSGLQAPGLWSAGGTARVSETEHAGGPADPRSR